MIELILLHCHIVAILYIFTKRWQEAGAKEGILGVALMGLMFVIGWSVTSPLAGFIMPDAWRTQWFTQDTLSLLLLLIPEVIFFAIFFMRGEGKVLASNTNAG
ncbi:MAG: hypothetical protein JNL32_13810 [Candidatus Kapabacteria bacterium]|nr:hypothetical protein [Candidatus Kapabacteria bacterium]